MVAITSISRELLAHTVDIAADLFLVTLRPKEDILFLLEPLIIAFVLIVATRPKGQWNG